MFSILSFFLVSFSSEQMKLLFLLTTKLVENTKKFCVLIFSIYSPTTITGAGLMTALGVGVVTVQATTALLTLPGNLERQVYVSLQAEEDTLSNSLQWYRYVLAHCCKLHGKEGNVLNVSFGLLLPEPDVLACYRKHYYHY